MTNANLRICYLVGTFPSLSETFILQEIEHHIGTGASIHVISCFKQDDSRDCLRLAPTTRSIAVSVFNGKTTAAKVAAAIDLGVSLLLRPRWWRVVFGRGFGALRDRFFITGIALAFSRRGDDFDVIHCHFGQRGIYAVALRKLGLTKAKIVTTLHGNDLSGTLRRYGRSYYQQLLKSGDLFLPISEFWKRRLIELGCDPSRVIVHHMGIDCAAIAFKERYGRSGELTQLISIGRLVEKKGHEFTLRALAALRKRRPDLAFAFDLVGEGPQMSRLKRMASELAIEDAVTFWGGLPHSQTLDLLSRAMIFVLPSVTAADGDMEGIPVSLMEAMAVGLPIISTGHSGIPELVEDQVSGLLVEERDIDGLSRAIERLLCTPQQWCTMGRAGRLRIEQAFNHADLMTKLEEYYRFLAGPTLEDHRAAKKSTAA